MSEGAQVALWIVGVHLIGFIAIAVLMLPALREDPGGPNHRDDENGGGWGQRGPKTPPSRPRPPRGGIPLPDAVQAPVRLRGPGRLSELRPARERRPVRDPSHPSRPGYPGRRPARTHGLSRR